MSQKEAVKGRGGAAAMAWLAAVLLCPFLALVPSPGAAGDVPQTPPVEVLFFFGPDEYFYANGKWNSTTDVLNASREAAAGLDKTFRFEERPEGLWVEIAGLSPPANASWEWSLLLWDWVNLTWDIVEGRPRDLKALGGKTVAWCPSDGLFPATNPLGRHPWPMFRAGPQRRGESLSPPVLSNLTYWTNGAEAPVFSSPCVMYGRVYVLAGGSNGSAASVSCYDAGSGTSLWRTALNATGPQYSSPACAQARVYAGGSDGRLSALDAVSGEVEWEYECQPSERGVTSSPAVLGDRVLFAGGDGFAYCIRTDGTDVWRTDLGAPVFLSSVSVWEDRLVVGTEEGRLWCLGLSDGRPIWNISLAGPVRTTPAISEGYAFVSAQRYRGPDLEGMNLYSVFLRDGVVQWNYSYPASLSSPAFSGGGLYLGTGAEFVGHHPDRGYRFWGVPFYPVNSSPAAGKGYVYFTTDFRPGTVGCVRVGGFLEWNASLPGTLFSSPALADGRLFVCTVEGNVACLGRPRKAALAAHLSAPAEATERSRVEVRVQLNNTGDAGAIVTVHLAVDGRRTSVRKGPLDVPAGASLAFTLGWTAVKGKHVLELSVDEADLLAPPVTVDVKPGARTCSVALLVSALAVACGVAPLAAGWTGENGRGDVQQRERGRGGRARGTGGPRDMGREGKTPREGRK